MYIFKNLKILKDSKDGPQWSMPPSHALVFYPPTLTRADLCNQKDIAEHNGVWYLSLSDERHCTFHWVFSKLTCSGGRKLPCGKDTQAAPRKGLCGKELRPHADNQH